MKKILFSYLFTNKFTVKTLKRNIMPQLSHHKVDNKRKKIVYFLRQSPLAFHKFSKTKAPGRAITHE